MIAEIIRTYLNQIIENNDSDSAREWFFNANKIFDKESVQSSSFGNCYAASGRLLGRLKNECSTAQIAKFRNAGITDSRRWSVIDFGRTLLLLKALKILDENQHVEFISRIFRTGDITEQQAILRGLVLYPDDVRFLDISLNACRSNVKNVFEAIACENEYPAQFFPDLNFNQLVLKALFIGTPINRIVGLDDRRTPLLVQMVVDYANELRAAGREVSVDIQSLEVFPSSILST